MFKNEIENLKKKIKKKKKIENCKKLKPNETFEFIDCDKNCNVISKKKIEIWTKERWYTLMWIDKDLW